MKKIFKISIVVVMAIICFGCSNNKEQKKTEKESVTEVSGNTITYKSEGTPVKDSELLGKNVYVFSTEDKTEDIKKQVSDIYEKQQSNQFGDERYAILFMPGEYDKTLEVDVGFYTQAAGLGIMPTDTNINKLWVNADWMSHNATCNFWRSAENFSVNEFCMWANSQAVSLRRVSFGDSIVFSDGEGWSSGGFMADCDVEGTVYPGSQQQYLCRNDEWSYWDGGVWNMVFTGINPNRIPSGSWPSMPYTKVETTPEIQEKPYICYDEKQGYGVMVPENRKDSQGISWKDGVKGTFYSLNLFYIADPEKDNSDTLNQALNEGKHILLTPGIYKLDKPLEVTKENTIVYGMGLATLMPNNGNGCMNVADVSGVKVCGILFEAGEKESKTLLQVGDENANADHSDNPLCFSDVYFRVGGGSYAGKVQNCVTIECNNVIGDNFWVWRADHSTNVGWDVNTAPNGIIINGDNVTMYGLFVEHFQEYQTIWNGNGGKLYFYQSEIPYDAPNQKAFMSHDGKVNGYASLKVGDDVTRFDGYGMGVYCFNRDADIEIFSGVEVPDVEGVALHNVVTVKLNGQGQITHVVNDQGQEVTRAGNTARVMEYENGLKE
ncbi:MAG: sialidase [Eubacterium sp.]